MNQKRYFRFLYLKMFNLHVRMLPKILFLIFASLNNVFAEQPTLSKFTWGKMSAISSAVTGSTVQLANWQFSSDDQSWQDISIPFFAQNLDELHLRCIFNVPDSLKNKKISLISEGIKGKAQIFLNGKLIHYQSNNYGPFKVEISPSYLTDQNKNELKFYISQSASGNGNFPQFANLFAEEKLLGITRPINILFEPQNRISNFTTALKFSGATVTFSYSYQLELNPGAGLLIGPLRIEETFSDTHGAVIYQSNKSITAESQIVSGEFSIPQELLWSPDRPTLLSSKIKIKTILSEILNSEFKFGLRQLAFESRKFRLNGTPILIKGVNYRENLAELLSADYSATLFTDFSNLKKLGFNAVRLPHHLPDQTLLSTADSLGLMVFIELPIWRYPAPMFLHDHLLESAKSSIRYLGSLYAGHPSLVALSLGQEIPIHESAAQKFMLILRGSIPAHLTVLSYLSPIPGKPLPLGAPVDFYMLDLYSPLQSHSALKFSDASAFALAGNLGVIKTTNVYDWDRNTLSTRRAYFLQRETNSALSRYGMQGGFIESYTDWNASLPTFVTIADQKPLLMPSGIFQANHQPKQWLPSISDFWKGDGLAVVDQSAASKQTNFFTIVILLTAAGFFAFYRKSNRLRENFKRAIRHSYGFYVDLRERRIIPLFNSLIVGAFASLILAVYVASFIYYYNDSYGMQEFIGVFLIPFNLFENYLSLSQSAFGLTIFFFLLFFAYPLLISAIMKFIGIFSRENIRFRQATAIGMWSGIPIILMLPASMLSYQFLPKLPDQTYFFYLLIFFLLWAHSRIIKGIRVLLMSKLGKVFIVVLLSYLIPLLIFWAVFEPTEYWIDYLKLLLNAPELF